MWEMLQQKHRNNDSDIQSKQFAKIRFTHCLTKEVDSGKVSHQLLSDTTLEDRDGFMYQKLDRFDTMQDVIWWMPYNYADGYARSVRGVASFMAMHDDLSNRFLCSVFDAGFLSSSLLLQPNNQTDLSKINMIRIGPYAVLPPELKAVQSSFQPQIAPLVSLRELSENIMKNNTGMYRQHPESVSPRGGQEKTARQVVEETNKEARYEKAAVAHRYDHLDRLYRIVMTRLLALAEKAGKSYPGQKEAIDFKERCMDRGVPEDLILGFTKLLKMRASRSIGLGSPSAQYDITNQLMAQRGQMDEQGRTNAFRDWLRIRVGIHNVNRYKPMQNRNDIPSNAHSIAALENNDLLEGSNVVTGADQIHFIHVNSHIEGALSKTAQAVQEGQYQDPIKMATILSSSIQHIAQHLSYLSLDEERKAFVKEVESMLGQVASFIPKLQKQAEQMQQQQQAQQAEQQQLVDQAGQTMKDRDFEAKVLEINKNFELERMKQGSLNQARAEKTDEQLSIRRHGAEADIQLKRELQEAEIEIKRLTAAQGE
jgi:hypothetical protein